MIFAHTESGVALEPQPATSSQEYVKFVSGGRDTSSWRIEEVPAGTVAGATPDGQGGWVNPAPPPGPPPQAAYLSGVEFHNYCAGVLAATNAVTPIEGMSRLGDVLAALAVASVQGGLMMIAWVRYQAAGAPGGRYTFSDVQTLAGAMAAAKIITAQEEAALIVGWPKT